MMAFRLSSAALAASLAAVVSAQTFQRLGTCPELGCILPPDAQDFLAGQYFDIRVEIHAPVNGSEATDGMQRPAFPGSFASFQPSKQLELCTNEIFQASRMRTSL
jgi:hypothetical protein